MNKVPFLKGSESKLISLHILATGALRYAAMQQSAMIEVDLLLPCHLLRVYSNLFKLSA